jgi:uncharacterized damage-inducible protein DinB
MCRSLLLAFFAVAFAAGQSAPQKPVTLKEVLLEQLRTTDDQKDWFVPISVAIEGLTPEQAKWTDGKGNHSIGQLVNHLAFWNARALQQVKHEKPAAFDGNNDETFNSFDAKTWSETAKRLNSLMKQWEQAVEQTDDEKLKQSASLVAHVGTHNAYHVGQIVYIRRLQGSWNPANGVK